MTSSTEKQQELKQQEFHVTWTDGKNKYLGKGVVIDRVPGLYNADTGRVEDTYLLLVNGMRVRACFCEFVPCGNVKKAA